MLNSNEDFDISGVLGLTALELLYFMTYLGKTYYFEYEIFKSKVGKPIHKGVVKQKFGDDNWNLNQIVTSNSDCIPMDPLY